MPVIYSATFKNAQPTIVAIQTTASTGVPGYFISGLASNEKANTKLKLHMLLKKHGIRMPKGKVFTQCIPSSIANTHHSLDFGLFVSLLSLKNTVKPTDNTLYVGALTAEGALLETPGVFALVLRAKEKGIQHFCVPSSIEEKIAQLTQANVTGFQNLQEYIAHCAQQKKIASRSKIPLSPQPVPHFFSQVAGQHSAKRALIIALAGKHPLLLVGPPGNGKTLLAEAAAELQPPPSPNTFTHIQKMHALVNGSNTFVLTRPFLHPPHTTTFSELFGSQKSYIPSILEQAHSGILFLDELPEFSKKILTALRTPLEKKELCRTIQNDEYCHPFDCTIIAAANPCPCGYYQVPQKICTCMPHILAHYTKKISGPLADRFHLYIKVPRLDAKTLLPHNHEHTQEKLHQEFLEVRKKIQEVRQYNTSQSSELKLALTPTANSLLSKAHQKLHLSARRNMQCQKVAQTIALLDGCDQITADHIAESLQYRIQ